MARAWDHLSTGDIEADLAKVVQARKDGLSIDAIIQACNLPFKRVQLLIRLAKLRKLIPAARPKPKPRPASPCRVAVVVPAGQVIRTFDRGLPGSRAGAAWALASERRSDDFLRDQDALAQEVLRQHGVAYPSLAIKSSAYPRFIEPSRFQGSSAGSSAAYAAERGSHA